MSVTEFLTLGLFCGILLICLMLKLPILVALTFGLVLFCMYAVKQGFRPAQLPGMCWKGILTAKNVLTTFLCIGILTAMWRAAGTIPTIICYSSVLFFPACFLTVAFLLNSMVSFLTGTSFGTAATMGVICAAMASAMGISPVLSGGAILSGAFFGDRCSPVSTSCLLVAELTETDIFNNVRKMMRNCAVPLVLTCVIYTVVGYWLPRDSTVLDFNSIFRSEFNICPAALLPAAAVLVLSFFRVPVRRTMMVSIVCALPIAVFFQHQSLAHLLQFAVFGFTADGAELADLMNGGGLLSMVRVACIVCISSAYSGIFQTTGLLSPVQEKMKMLSGKITEAGTFTIMSVLTGMIACNQTLSIMLTNQLCGGLRADREKTAMDLENTAVVIAPLIPWSIAGAVPLASVSAPSTAILFAVYLYLLPVWHILHEILNKHREGTQ